MTKLDEIKAAHLQARKDRDSVAAGILSLIITRAATVTKNEHAKGAIANSDSKVLSAVKDLIVEAKQTQSVLQEGYAKATGAPFSPDAAYASADPEVAKIGQGLNKAARELAILEAYEPKALSDEELAAEIARFKAENAGANMGSIMKHLKENFEGRYNGKLASDIAKQP